MSVTVNFTKDHAMAGPIRAIGPKKVITGSIAFDDSYPTDGEPLDLSSFMRRTLGVFIPPVSGYIFEYDDENEKVKVYEGEGTPSGTVSQPTFTGDPLNDIDFTVKDDDSAATNGTKVYAAQDRGKTEEAMLWSEMENGGTVKVETASGSIEIPVIHKLTENSTYKVMDDDSAASNGTALYAVLTGERTPWGAAIAVLQSVNANNADSSFDVSNPSDTFPVFDNDNAATAGPAGLSTALQVYVDEDLGNKDNRLMVNNAGTGALAGLDVYIRSESGRYLQIKHNADASSDGVAVYFDDNGATAAERLLFVSPTDSNMTDGDIGHRDGVYAVDGIFLAPIYFDDDATNENERLLWVNPSEVDTFARLTSDNRMVKLTHNMTAVDTFTLYLGGATGGTFDLGDGSSTETLNYDDSAATIEAALDKIFGEGLVTVAADSDFTITFNYKVGDSGLQADFSSLTGATDPALTETSTYAGADTVGTQLYIDDDATITERLLAVTAGDADSTVQLSPNYQQFGEVPSGTVSQPTFTGTEGTKIYEVDNGEDLSALTDVPFMAWGY